MHKMATSIPRENSVSEDKVPASPDGPEKNQAKTERVSKFPLSRIKLIMKTDPDLTLASQESVFLIAKASELFLDDLTKSAYEYTSRNKKKTVKKQDVELSVESKDAFAFLEGILDS